MTVTTIHLNTEYKTAIRFPSWLALMVFSIICLASMVAQTPGPEDRRRQEKWAMAITALSICISFTAVCCYLCIRSLFVAQVPEVAMLALTLSLWGVGLPSIMNPQHGIAVLNVTVVNANLYFFSWLSFANCLFLMTSLVQDVMGIQVRDVAQPKLSRWIALTASSLVVMGSAVRIFSEESYDCGNPESVLHASSFCTRTRVAIAFGTVSIVASTVCAIAVHRAWLSTAMEFASSSLIFIFWCFGVAYVTFGFSAPGSRIGNLFFSTWISFILSMVSFVSSFQAWYDSRNSMNSTNDTTKDGDEEHTDEDEEEQETDVVDFPTNYRSEVPVTEEATVSERLDV